MRVLLTADPEIPVPPTLYGGIERIVDGLAGELRRRGHTVGLVAHADSTCDVDAFFPWPGLRSQSRTDTVRNTATLLAAVRRFRPDVLHSYSRVVYMLPLLRASLPKIMSYQRDPGGRPVSIGSRIGGRTLTFTGCSEHICARGRAHGGTWRAVHNFVPVDRYQFRGNVADDAPLVFLSRVERIKGASTAIEIARDAGRRLVIAGNHADSGDELDYWTSEVEPHVDGDRVMYVGPVDDVQKDELLGSAAAMIVPIQWNEPFGIVFAESLACGTPVISRPFGALPEIVRDGVDGFLVDDVASGVQAVARLGDIDRRACRARAEACFSTEVIVSRYESLYADVVSGGRRAEATA